MLKDEAESQVLTSVTIMKIRNKIQCKCNTNSEYSKICDEYTKSKAKVLANLYVRLETTNVYIQLIRYTLTRRLLHAAYCMLGFELV